MTKIRLTKKRLRTLHAALTVDDILYRKFQQLMDDVKKAQARYVRMKQIIRVVQVRGNMQVPMQIESVHVTPDGTVVIVR